MNEIAVIGGGIAGLCTAYEILDLDPAANVHVYERTDEPGGNIRTEHADGFTIEAGPNGFLDNVPETLDLICRLGISERTQPADAASKRRFIYRNGRLHEIKANPIAFLTSNLLTLSGRLRIMAEPFTPRARTDDQTVYEFASRHIGQEAASILVDAMVSGVFAGSSKQLSLQSAFPKMHEMERRHRSLVLAMFAKMRDRKNRKNRGGPSGPAGHLTSFQNGLSDLIDALSAATGTGRLHTGDGITAVEYREPYRFVLTHADGRISEATSVVLAASAWNAAELVHGLSPALSSALKEIPGAPIAVVALGYSRSDVPDPLEGFGYLVPRGEEITSLGTLWTSSIFPGRAPDGSVLLRTMIGGAHSPELLELCDEELLETVRNDLKTTLGVTADPALCRIYRYQKGIPQYVVGHSRRLESIRAELKNFPGLHVTGNSYNGIAMNACIRDAGLVARDVLATKKHRTIKERPM